MAESESNIRVHTDGKFVTLQIPMDEVQSLRVALQECPCRAPKTHSNVAMRRRIVRALGAAFFKKGQAVNA